MWALQFCLKFNLKCNEAVLILAITSAIGQQISNISQCFYAQFLGLYKKNHIFIFNHIILEAAKWLFD